MKNLLVRVLGFPATLMHHDTMVIDRWLWLRARLPRTRNHESLLDVGCGTGAFSIGAALRGYSTVGLTWDNRDCHAASQRAEICGAPGARFEVQDARLLDDRQEFVDRFDVVITMENIEHVLNDKKLIRDLAACIKAGGRLLLTTPYYHYRPISKTDMGPFSRVEDGGHVLRGYTPQMLIELCEHAGLRPEAITFASGVMSQKVTWIFRVLRKLNPLLAWAAIAPLRVLPVVLDGVVTPLLRWPRYSICLEAYKPS